MGLTEVGNSVHLTKRPLDFVYLIDTSLSMRGNKIQALNNAMLELEHAIKEEASKNPTADVNIRIITFNGLGSKWYLEEKTLAKEFKYKEIDEDDLNGKTPLGSAVNLLCDDIEKMSIKARNLPPVFVLLSDGLPTDEEVLSKSIDRLNNLPWAKKAIKISIAIGNVGKAALKCLEDFAGNPNHVFEAKNSTSLIQAIKWTSTIVSHVSKHSSISLNLKVPQIPQSMITPDSDF